MIDLSKYNIEKPKTKDNSIAKSDGGITFVYHKNGKRIVFSKRVLTILGNPEMISFGFIENHLIISPTVDEGFTLKEMSKQKVIYNASLISEIFDYYNINYENDLCKTFSDIEIVDEDKNIIAINMTI